MREATKHKYDEFCMEFVTNGRNSAKAAVSAGYKAKGARQQAQKLLQIPYVCDKLRELEAIAARKAKEKFNITLEQRLEWLEYAVKAGFREIPLSSFASKEDHNLPTKAENLPASISAIKELNEMLGTDTHEGVKPVKVFIGVQDAS